VDVILPAFSKLVENLINIHKFTGLYDSYDDLKNDCVNFLFETIMKFDNDRGTNAFSYFNVVAKNWLIIRSKQRAIKSKKNISIDDVESLTTQDMFNINEHQLLPSQDVVFEKQMMTHDIVLMLNEMRDHANNENELICIDSIIVIFEWNVALHKRIVRFDAEAVDDVHPINKETLQSNQGKRV
jgi:hypothetical protein